MENMATRSALNPAISGALQAISDYQNYMTNGHLDPQSEGGSKIDSYSHDAVIKALDPAYSNNLGLCTNTALFQILPISGGGGVYDWRVGMKYALFAVATRLLAIGVVWPDYRTTGVVTSELAGMRNCLIEHRDKIHPPKPFSYCHTYSGCGSGSGGCGCSTAMCKEWRSWPQWHTDYSYVLYPNCTLTPSPLSEMSFWDLEAVAASTIDNNNLASVVFTLQRMIDTLYVLIPPNTDPAPQNQHVPFGANTQLCLSQNANGRVVLDDCSSATALLNWTYDRATGRIKNTGTNQCIGVSAAVPTQPLNTTMVTCTDDDSDAAQIWDWNPESGLVKNSWGSALSVTDTVPAIGSLVCGRVENSWYLNKQVWKSGASLPCTGDICVTPGSAAWRQGTIAGTQRYPMDFNIFTYAGASGFQDVGGPVAANGALLHDGLNTSVGGISAGGFSVNEKALEPVALLDGGGSFSFSNGTIFDNVYIAPGVKSTITNVTFKNGTVVTTASPINFEMAFVKLLDWSTALSQRQTTGSVAFKNGLLQMTTSSGNLNVPVQVFSVDGATFYGVRSYQFNVPAGSTVLINVSGFDANIWAAGFSGLPAFTKVLWNFYEARTLETRYVGFPGSILAPQAYAQLQWGSVAGTLVASSVDTTSQFDWLPFSNNALVTGQ